MTTYCLTKSALIAEITAAFDGVTRDDGITLHQAIVLDYYDSEEAQAAARTMDTETRWQDVPHTDIARNGSVLSFLDPKGFHYYIPAYMVWYLNYTDNPDYGTSTPDSIRFHLTGGYESELDDFNFARFALFSPEQSRAIAHFLVYLAEEIQWNWESDTYREIMEAKFHGTVVSVEAEAAAWEEARQWMAEKQSDYPQNEALRAIDQYWGQFL